MAEPLRLYAQDNLQNVISGLGTYKDKTIATQYVFVPLGIPQLEAAYRGEWIARKIVDIPAQDSTRMWREWQAEKEEINKIEDLERDLDIQGKVNKAMTLARLYGGSALILGVEGAGHEKEELDVEKVKQDSLKFVHAVHRWEIGTNETDFDLNSKNYRLPKYYTVKSGIGETLDIHWTRVIRFIGSPIPDPAQAPEGWGDSILQVVDTAIKGAGIVIGGIASLVQEAKIDVISMPNLSERLSTKEYADKLSQRMTYANVIKSMNNALIIDTAETWQRIQTNFAALPDILQNYLICAAGAADIPATRLIGQSPRGLNATGESDIRNYYDKIKSEQNTILRPALSTLDEVLIRSALGSRDEGIFYEWRSLWQMTEAEMADLAQKKAATYQIDVNTGLLDSNALRIGRENQLIEDGTYPGLEQTLQDQEDGKIPTEAERFAHDPEMNPDHPQNIAAQESAMAQAKEAEFHAKNPLAAIKAKAKANGKGNPFEKKKTTDFNPNHDPSTGEFTSGPGGSSGGSQSPGQSPGQQPQPQPPKTPQEVTQQKGALDRIIETAKGAFDTKTKIALWGAGLVAAYTLYNSDIAQSVLGTDFSEAAMLHVQAVNDVATSVAKDLNFDPEKIYVSPIKYVIDGNPVLGEYSPGTGLITLYAPHLNPTNLKETAGVIAHEVMHGNLHKALVADSTIGSFITSNFDKLRVSGEKLAIGAYQGNNWSMDISNVSKVGETLSDLAYHKSTTGSLPRNLANEWVELFNMVMKAARR